MHVWLNGTFVEQADASVSIFDAGWQHAVGLFETMAARNGSLFRLGAHLDRLAESARSLMLTERLRTEPLAEAVRRTLTYNELSEARVRLTVTGGNLNLLQSQGETPHDPTIAIVPQPPTRYPDAFFENGIGVMIADGRRNPLDPMAGHKTLNYWANIRALQQAASRGAGEALWFTVSNHLAGGSVSNAFLVKDETIFTPIARGEEPAGSLPAPVLPGITRDVIRELAAEDGWPVESRMLSIEDLLAADEVFLTNSSWGVLPVVAVERETIGDGRVGAITRHLREAWLVNVERETNLGMS